MTATGKIRESTRVNQGAVVEVAREEMSDVEENDGDAVAMKELGKMDEEKEYEDGEKGEDENEQDKTQSEDVEGKSKKICGCYID